MSKLFDCFEQILKNLDQKIDDFIANFYDKLIVLFLIQIFGLLLFAVSIVNIAIAVGQIPVSTELRTLSMYSAFFMPLSLACGFLFIRNAGWHFYNTLEKRSDDENF